MFTDVQLTAYALNELPDTERLAVERYLVEHPEARAVVDETRQLAASLTDCLAAEAAPVAVAEPVFVTSRRSRVYTWMALAASVLMAVGLVGYAMKENDRQYAKDTTRYITVHGKPVSRPDLRSFSRLSFNNPDSETPPPSLDDDTNVKAPVTAEPAALPIPDTTALPMGVLPHASSGDLGVLGTAGAGPPASKGVNGLTIAPGFKGRSGATSGKTANGDSYGGTNGGNDHRTPTLPPLRQTNPGESKGDGKTPPPNLDDFGKFNVTRIPGKQDDAEKRAKGAHPYEPSHDPRFPDLEENVFTKVEGKAALSTFGVDVDTASYSIMRKFLAQNQLPPPGAVRLEEMVNYFPYRDPAPTGADPYGVTIELAECPWQPKHRLARIGVKAKPIDFKNRPASNLVFLIDVSGSMMPEERLPLVKKSLKLLVDQLTENDRVALVVYASGTGVVLDSTSASKKTEILEALERLGAGGSTNGSGGIQLAYEVAIRNFIPGGTNRVILCTDGDWNVGTTSTAALISLIEEKRKSNVFLSVFGFGFGNLRDEMMVNLAGKGNGNYAYIDSLKEARKALVEQLGGTLITVAKDVKIQVEFNPARVGAYRLIGYEKRKLAAEDFHNDAKDAGEMGAGHVVTALYELAPAGEAVPPAVDGLRYQQAPAAAVKNDSKEAFVVKLRYKLPSSDVSTLREIPVVDSNKPYGEASEDFRFAAAVASYAMLLRDSKYKGNATYAAVIELAQAAKSWDPGEYRDEFVKLVAKAKTISGKP